MVCTIRQAIRMQNHKSRDELECFRNNDISWYAGNFTVFSPLTSYLFLYLIQVVRLHVPLDVSRLPECYST